MKITHLKVVLIFGLALASSMVLAGEISTYYRNLPNKSRDFSKSRNHDQVASTNHGITEIGIERTTCFGTCPAYTFILKSDGTIRYVGDRYVERKGSFTGRISMRYFNPLAQFIKDSDYAGFQDSYSRTVTDNPTVYTSVVLDGKRKTISNYANAGPTKLWAIEQLIDNLMAKVAWQDSPTNSGSVK